jgi:hypothetical protein
LIWQRSYTTIKWFYYGLSQMASPTFKEYRNDSTIQNLNQIPLKFEKVYVHHTFKDLKM